MITYEFIITTADGTNEIYFVKARNVACYMDEYAHAEDYTCEQIVEAVYVNVETQEIESHGDIVEQWRADVDAFR